MAYRAITESKTDGKKSCKMRPINSLTRVISFNVSLIYGNVSGFSR
jgi:hypothetical protein